MRSVFLDSNVLIAARLARDENHEQARTITDALDDGSLPTCRVPGDVLQEVLNYVTARCRHGDAVDTLDAVLESRGFELHHTTSHDFRIGRSLFRRYRGLSLTDAMVVATMQRTGARYLYSFDDDFDAIEGIARLTTPSNPFA